jgi:hypothetical protein
MSELLMLLALGVFMWLLSVYLPAWRKRRQSEIPPRIGPQVPPVLPRARTLPPPPVMSLRGPPLLAAQRPVATRQRAPWRLGSRRDIRRGIVLMTILGPCRTLEPPEPPR